MNKFVLLVLLILASVGKWCCEGCWEEERDALLQLKASFYYPSRLTDWVDDTDCCKWKGVSCNTTKSRVTHLNLNVLWGYELDGYRWYLNFSYFRVFENLKSLSLWGNNIGGCVQNLGRYFSLIPSKGSKLIFLIFKYLKISVMNF